MKHTVARGAARVHVVQFEVEAIHRRLDLALPC